MRNKTLLGIALFLLLALASRVLLISQQDDEQIAVQDINLQLDYALDGLSARWYDANGQARGRLQAPRIIQDTETGVGQVEAPRVQWQGEDQSLVEISAEQGIINNSRNQFSLAGGVRLVQSRLDRQLVSVEAEQLTLQTDQDLISSSGQVTITQPGAVIRGVGMEADLGRREYRLLSQVEGRYEVR